MVRETNLRRLWHNGLGVAVVIWVLVGFWALTMPVAFVLWVVIGVVAGLLLYFGSERAIERGAGR